MYIPLIPQRREHPSSIWGPQGHSRQPSRNEQAWNPDLRSGLMTTDRAGRHTVIDTPDTDSTVIFGSTTNPAFDQGHRVSPAVTELYNSQDNTFAMAQLLRDLHFTSPQSDVCIDTSVLTSSSGSSPVNSLPTPPDASPIQFHNHACSSAESLSNSISTMNVTSSFATPTRRSELGCTQSLNTVVQPDAKLVVESISRIDQSVNSSPAVLSSSRFGDIYLGALDAHGLRTPSPGCSASVTSFDCGAKSAGPITLWQQPGLKPGPLPYANGLESILSSKRVTGRGCFSARPVVDDQSLTSWNQEQSPLLNEPINFLHLLSPTSSPQYSTFVQRIISHSDQQASIFLQQKLKASADDPQERAKIVDAICGSGFEMMCNRFGNWAVQRCLDSNLSGQEKMRIVNCIRGKVVDLATNCYGTHCVQKLLDCEEEIRLAILSELLMTDPCRTLLNKHASHVWSKIMELTWTSPAPPIFDYINRALSGKWHTLACHETGSLVVQHAFENLEPQSKEDIVHELLQDDQVFKDVVKNQWGSFCISHLLELGSPHHKRSVHELLLANLLEYSTHEHGIKSVLKAIKEGDDDVREHFVEALSHPPKSGRRATIVDVALSSIGSQLLTTILPLICKEQRSKLYESIKPFIVTLRGSKTGSKAIWLFDRVRSAQ